MSKITALQTAQLRASHGEDPVPAANPPGASANPQQLPPLARLAAPRSLRPRTESLAHGLKAPISTPATGVAARGHEVSFSFGNDFLAMGGEDDGFTNAFLLGYKNTGANWNYGIEVEHSVLTESRVNNWRADGRIDMVQVLASAEHNFNWGQSQLSFGPTVGVQATGNLGGQGLQHWFHGTFDAGRTLEEGLQDRYIAPNRLVPVFGASLSAHRPLGEAGGGRWWVDGQVQGTTAVGDAGVSSLTTEGMLGYGLNADLWNIRPTARVGGHAGVHTTDELGRLDGTYQSGRVYLAPAVEVGFEFGRKAHLRWGTMWDYRGSNEPAGYISFKLKS